MIQANKYKLGIFISSAVALIIVSLFVTGMSQFFEDRIEIFSVFKNSVDGLVVGSQVKYKGVPLGRVTRIAMRSSDSYINVYMEIFPSAMDVPGVDDNSWDDDSNSEVMEKYVDKMIKNGLRCSIQLAGVSGTRFIEFDSTDPQKKLPPPLKVKVPQGMLYVPSKPTYISGAIENISKTARELAQIDFNKLSKEFSESFAKLNEFTNTAQNQLKILKTGDIRNRILNTMAKFDQTLDAVTQLCQDLDEDPNAIIKGKRQKRIFKSD
jgi:paraquat-inducible protein B